MFETLSIYSGGQWLDHDPFHLVERPGIIPPIIEVSGAGGFVAAICWATSSLLPFCWYALMPVARNVWEPIRRFEQKGGCATELSATCRIEILLRQ